MQGLLAIAILFFYASVTHAAGFDCAKAATRVERMICADTELSSMDKDVSENFSNEIEREERAAKLRPAQKKWLAIRNACTDALCVRKAYEKRLAELTCDPDSQMGSSAIGVNQCSYYTGLILERELVPLELRFSDRMAEGNNNTDYVKRCAEDERKAWRSYMSAQCALYGSVEGGSDGWKNAFANMCRIDETKKRIARLKQELVIK